MKNIPLREDIPRLYLEEKLSTPQIAKMVGLSVGAVGSILKSRGIKLRTPKEGVAVRFPNGAFGEQASNWRGGRRIAGHKGYVRVYAPEHPNAVSKSVFEHTLVAEQKIGRYLAKDEVVHHINGKKDDNRPENLEVCKRSEHVHHHFTAGKGIQALHSEIKRLKDLLDKHSIEY